MGGSFDPVHVGHVRFGTLACGELDKRGTGPTWLALAPAARSPFKAARPAASDADRVHMLRLATEGLPNTRVWTDELDRAAAGEPSYTIDTLRRARQWLDMHGNAGTKLHLLIGADQAAAFHRWREAPEILKLASPLVVGRESVNLERELAGHWDEATMKVWCAGLLQIPELPISSTMVREAIAAGDYERARPWLHPLVLDYIRERHLYHA
jgi:nicotinate-nucleotide adenylyltransferase